MAGPEPLPFMALQLDHYGRPFYGSGASGYARKVFAKLFDPKFSVPAPTKEQAKLITEGEQRTETALNDKLGWDQWIGKWTGITAEDVAEATASARVGRETAVEKETGETRVATGIEQAGNLVKMGTGLMVRESKEVIAGGFELLQLVDKLSRKSRATDLAMDDIGDSSSILPDMTVFDDGNRW